MAETFACFVARFASSFAKGTNGDQPGVRLRKQSEMDQPKGEH